MRFPIFLVTDRCFHFQFHFQSRDFSGILPQLVDCPGRRRPVTRRERSRDTIAARQYLAVVFPLLIVAAAIETALIFRL